MNGLLHAAGYKYTSLSRYPVERTSRWRRAFDFRLKARARARAPCEIQRRRTFVAMHSEQAASASGLTVSHPRPINTGNLIREL